MTPKLLVALLLLDTLLYASAAQTISCAIRQISKRKVNGELERPDSTEINEHWVGFDSDRRLVYVSVEVAQEELNKGAEVVEEARQWVKKNGAPDDVATQIVDAKLGGPGTIENVFAAAGKVSLLSIAVYRIFSNCNACTTIFQLKNLEKNVFKM